MGDMNLQSMETPKGITAEDVWAMFRETDRRQKETDRQLRETQRIVGDLGNRFGDIAEQLLTPGLEGKFDEFGFSFEELNRNVKWRNKRLDFSMEFDAVLENGEQAMIVEVKAKLSTAAVDDQIKRMEKLRRYADTRGDKRRFYCAMAALTASDRVINYVLSNGFYLIMPSGEDVKISGPLSGPEVW